MARLMTFFLLLVFNNGYAKTSTLNMTIGANITRPTCTMAVPAEFNFGNISASDFLNGDAALRTRTISITASCPYIPRVDLMLIPQHGTVSGRANSALTSNASVSYSVSLVDLGVNNVNFSTNTSWTSPGTTAIRMTLAQNGSLAKGVFNTSITVRLTYI